VTGKAFIILLHAMAVDGDTITAGGTAVRLWGVDAPEVETAAGRRAAGPQGICTTKDILWCKAQGRRAWRLSGFPKRSGGLSGFSKEAQGRRAEFVQP